MTTSTKSTKQRKKFYNSPWHKAIKLMSAPLSKDLRTRFKIRAIPVRTNDSVKIVSGGFKGRSGKVARVNVKRRLVFVEGITGKAQKGKTKMVGIHVSNLTLTKLDLSDKYRRRILERKGVSSELVEREFEEQAKTEAEQVAGSQASEQEPAQGSSDAARVGEGVELTQTASAEASAQAQSQTELAEPKEKQEEVDNGK
jgi:large subunit ribosomal protein L24